MNPLSHRSRAGASPHFALILILAAIAPATAAAQPAKGKRDRAKPAAAETSKKGDAGKKGDAAKKREKVFDFTGFELAGSVRMPQLLYFLDRAEEELERASLERRSFIPAMMKSLDEEKL